MLTETWRKSDRSNPSGNCVECRMVALGAAVEVRDSKDPGAGSLIYTRAEWQAFIDGATRGEFDLPD